MAGILCRLGALGGEFVRDDIPIVRDDPRTANFADQRTIWLTDWWANQTAADRVTRDPLRDRLYRPLPLFSIAAQRAILGSDPLAFHVFNVLAHALVCGLVNLFVVRITGSPLAAAIAGLLFALHPIHVEAVAEIVGRAELLAAAGLLVGLLLAIPPAGAPSIGRTCLAAIAFLAALLSKESAVCYPLLVAAVCWHFAQSSGKRTSTGRSLALAGILLTPLAIYAPLRFVALEGQFFRSQNVTALMNPLQAVGGWARVDGVAEVLGHYARVLAWPLRLSSDYSLSVCNPGVGWKLESVLGALAALGWVAATFFWISRRLRRRHEPAATEHAALFLVLGGISYALVSNIVVLIGVSVAERLLYTPSVFVLSAAAIGIASLLLRCVTAGNRLGCRIAFSALALLMASLAARSVVRSFDWRTTRTLLERDVATYPQNARLSYQLATLLVTGADSLAEPQRRAALDRVDQLTDSVLRVAPSYSKAIRVRALADELRGENARALAGYERTLELQPDDAAVAQRLAALRAWSVKIEAQLRELMQRAKESPGDAEIHVQLADALVTAGKYDEARRTARRALALEPATGSADRVMARLLLRTGDALGAMFHARRAIELNPDDALVRLTLAETLEREALTAQAAREYRAALGLLPASDGRRAAIESRIGRLEKADASR